ncbi:MAG: hypothetical protein HOW73_45210 [Polyangiaceae bacterium]|nr:hypothetical protein [Polyangiaceae bacterium]
MTSNRSFAAIAILLVTAIGCGDDTSDGGAGGGGSSADGGNGTGGTPSSDGGSGGSADTVGGGGTGGTGGTAEECPEPPVLEYDKNECLTADGAAQFCGAESDQTVCAFAIQCGFATDEAQCNVDCVDNSATHCYGDSNVSCAVGAMCDNDCETFQACGIVL